MLFYSFKPCYELCFWFVLCKYVYLYTVCIAWTFVFIRFASVLFVHNPCLLTMLIAFLSTRLFSIYLLDSLPLLPSFTPPLIASLSLFSSLFSLLPHYHCSPSQPSQCPFTASPSPPLHCYSFATPSLPPSNCYLSTAATLFPLHSLPTAPHCYLTVSSPLPPHWSLPYLFPLHSHCSLPAPSPLPSHCPLTNRFPWGAARLRSEQCLCSAAHLMLQLHAPAHTGCNCTHSQAPTCVAARTCAAARKCL